MLISIGMMAWSTWHIKRIYLLRRSTVFEEHCRATPTQRVTPMSAMSTPPNQTPVPAAARPLPTSVGTMTPVNVSSTLTTTTGPVTHVDTTPHAAPAASTASVASTATATPPN